MHPYRHRLIIQTLALLPSKRLICLAARLAYLQQGPCPPVWRPYLLYQYRRRQQALRWLLDAVARSLQGYMFVGFYLGALLPNMPSDDLANLLHVRTTYLQDLLNHTKEDSPTLAVEDDLPTKPTKPTGPQTPGKPCQAVSKNLTLKGTP